MKATLAHGCCQGSLREVSVGVLLPVCTAYTSSQKVGNQHFGATGGGGGRKTERGIPRPTNRHRGKCRISTGNGDKDSPRERKTQSQSLRQTDTETEKGRSTGRLRATARTALWDCGRLTEASERERPAGSALPGSPAHTPASRVQRRDEEDGGGVPAL